jgi:hypothetical protein
LAIFRRFLTIEKLSAFAGQGAMTSSEQPNQLNQREARRPAQASKKTPVWWTTSRHCALAGSSCWPSKPPREHTSSAWHCAARARGAAHFDVLLSEKGLLQAGTSFPDKRNKFPNKPLIIPCSIWHFNWATDAESQVGLGLRPVRSCYCVGRIRKFPCIFPC